MATYGTMRFWDEVVGQFEASFLAPERQSLEIVGSDGVLRAAAPWRLDWGGDLVLVRDGERRGRCPSRRPTRTRLELENFAAAAAHEAPALLGRGDATAQARVIDALYRSAESGRRPSRSDREVSGGGPGATDSSSVRERPRASSGSSHRARRRPARAHAPAARAARLLGLRGAPEERRTCWLERAGEHGLRSRGRRARAMLRGDPDRIRHPSRYPSRCAASERRVQVAPRLLEVVASVARGSRC